MTFWLALLGALIGAVAAEWWGLLSGASLGGLIGAVLVLRRRVEAAEARIDALVRGSLQQPAQIGLPSPMATPSPAPLDETAHERGNARPVASAVDTVAQAQATSDVPNETIMARAEVPSEARTANVESSATDTGTISVGSSSPASTSIDSDNRGSTSSPNLAPPAGNALDHLFAGLHSFFTTGNVVAKVGVVVLFFGVAFLLKYAYDNSHFPPALRLAASALGGVALVGFGWRLRTRADAYGLLLQGAGIGILYLTVFAAARLYGLVPLPAAFAIMVFIVAASCVLALLQNSEPLAVLAMGGGFLAPLLTSTGAGSHVALFSYYELLNLGILGMAAFRVWRWLNWTGFLFTFVIAGIWGARFYRPELLATTEPFLILFFLHYVAVIVLTTRQRVIALSSVVDGTLVFGLPLAAFGLQAGLVADVHFGLAFSALGMAAVYVVVLVGMGRRFVVPPALGESFIALALIFTSLAVPFAFDNQRWTAASWALEGAGLVWIGLRQGRVFNRWFGLLLQLAAGGAFIWALFAGMSDSPVLNSFFLGAALIAWAGWFTSFQFARFQIARDGKTVSRAFAVISAIAMVWGLLWWFIGWLREIADTLPAGAEAEVFVLIAAITFSALVVVGQRTNWRASTVSGLALLPLFALVWVVGVLPLAQSPLMHFGWVVWPLCCAALWWCLRFVENGAEVGVSASVLGLCHGASMLFGIALLSWLLAHSCEAQYGTSTWTQVLWALPSIVLVTLLPRFTLSSVELRTWPLNPHVVAYATSGAVLVACGLLWLVATSTSDGNPAPLPFVPLLNPLELAQAAALLASWHFIGAWQLRYGGDVLPVRAVIASVGFLWLNMIAARAVHFYAGVPFTLFGLWRAAVFQSAMSLLWSSLALIVMFAASRAGARAWWIGGAALLGVVVVKLLLVDLSDIGTVARIVSFIGVGALMLVIGYLAPLPRDGDVVAGPTGEAT